MEKLSPKSKIGIKIALFGCVLAVLGMSAQSCYYDNEEALYGIPVCDTSNVSYQNDIAPIMENSCAISGCHVPGGSGNGLFLNYAGVKDKVENGSMMERVVVVRDMPPGFSLTDCQVSFVEAWINIGSPNN